MGPFLLGLIALVLLLAALQAFTRADPKRLAIGLRRGGGVLLLLVAVGLALTGRWAFAAPVGLMGLGLLGLRGILPTGSVGGARRRPTPGSRSQVRSGWLEMTLDHDTGRLSGEVLKGRFAGRELDDLAEAELFELLDGIDDERSRQLLEAYIDRRQPGWREDREANASAGQGAPRETGEMTPQQAYEILGVPAGASPAEIRRAHRELMMKLHPDRGGSTWLAAKINEAKDLLLREHGTRA